MLCVGTDWQAALRQEPQDAERPTSAFPRGAWERERTQQQAEAWTSTSPHFSQGWRLVVTGSALGSAATSKAGIRRGGFLLSGLDVKLGELVSRFHAVRAYR
jgi:hypothetical protein